MIKKRILLLIVSILLIISATGCNDTLISLDEREVTVNLEGLPVEYNNYNIKLFAETDGGGIKNSFEYKDISPAQTLNKSLEINREADFILVYLFNNQNSFYDDEFDDPVYFYRYNISENKKEYNFSYWLDYYSFESYDEIEYGLSSQLVQTVESTLTKEIDFSEDKYYLLKIPYSAVNNDVQINSNMSTGDINISYSNYIDNLEYGYFRYVGSVYILKDSFYQNPIFVLIMPQDSEEETNGTIEITIN